MEIRNPTYTANGGIDCEINHSVYGWIPYSAGASGDVFDAIKPHAAPYIGPPLPDPIIAEREYMVASRFQAMVALMDAGLLSQINVALADAGPLAQLAWAEATEFRRNSPTIAGLSAGLGLTDTQVDDLFRAAMVIHA